MLTYIVLLLDKYNKIYTMHGTYYIKFRRLIYIDITKQTKLISEVGQLTEVMTREKYGLFDVSTYCNC
jgi:hypothetical protein